MTERPDMSIDSDDYSESSVDLPNDLDTEDVPLPVAKNTTGKNGHYVSKAELYKCYVEWYAAIEAAALAGKPEPEPPRYIVEGIILICEHLSYRYNFNGYSFVDEMVADGILVCTRKIKKFNPAVSDNPFWYFTRIAYREFVKRIKIEAVQSKIKKTMISTMSVDELFGCDSDDECISDLQNQYFEIVYGNTGHDSNGQMFDIFNSSAKKTPQPRTQKASKVSPLEAFFTEGDDTCK